MNRPGKRVFVPQGAQTVTMQKGPNSSMGLAVYCLIGFEVEPPTGDHQTDFVVEPDRPMFPVGIHMSAPEGVSIMHAAIGNTLLVRGPVRASIWNSFLRRLPAEGDRYPCVRIPDMPLLDPHQPLAITLRWVRRPGRGWSALDVVTGYVVVVTPHAYSGPA